MRGSGCRARYRKAGVMVRRFAALCRGFLGFFSLDQSRFTQGSRPHFSGSSSLGLLIPARTPGCPAGLKCACHDATRPREPCDLTREFPRPLAGCIQLRRNEHNEGDLQDRHVSCAAGTRRGAIPPARPSICPDDGIDLSASMRSLSAATSRPAHHLDGQRRDHWPPSPHSAYLVSVFKSPALQSLPLRDPETEGPY